MLAGALEALVPNQRLTRITVEMMRPIPMSGFRVQAAMRKPGRSVSLSEAELYDDDAVYARAYGLHARTVDAMEAPTPSVPVPDLTVAIPGPFPIDEMADGLDGFSLSVECRYDPSGSHGEGGPATMWMRTLVPLLTDEEPSPFQSICPLADCANGISRNVDIDEVWFVNPDLTVLLHRDPVGDWLCAQAISHWDSTGVGIADAALYDTVGPVGRAVQSLLLNPADG